MNNSVISETNDAIISSILVAESKLRMKVKTIKIRFSYNIWRNALS